MKWIQRVWGKLIQRLKPTIPMRRIPESFSPKHQSLEKPTGMNHELHRLSDLITTIQAKLPPRSWITSQFKEFETSIHIMEEQLIRIFAEQQRYGIYKQGTLTFLRWIHTGLTKLLDFLKRDQTEAQDFHQLFEFVYESVWKMIVLFEEGFGVHCHRCKKSKRMMVYPFAYDGTTRFFMSESKQVEEDMIHMIQQLRK